MKPRDALAIWDSNISTQQTLTTAQSLAAALSKGNTSHRQPEHDQVDDADPDNFALVVSYHQLLIAESASSSISTYKAAYSHSVHLSITRATIASMLDVIQSTIVRFNSLTQLYYSIAESTQQIRNACEQLSKEKESMNCQAEHLKYVISHFDDAFRLAHRLSVSANLTHQEWHFILFRINECISFMDKHQDSAEARQFLVRFHQLRTRALTDLCTQIYQLFSSVGSINVPSDPADRVASSLIEYRSIVPMAQPLIFLLEQRCHVIHAYGEALQECVQIYFNSRHKLLYSAAATHLATLASSKPLGEFARDGCMFLIRVCVIESRLFRDFFHDSSVFEILTQLVSNICSIFYIQIRPRIIYEEDIAALSDVVSIIRTEIIDDELLPRGEETACIIPVLQRTVEDVQERLIYRAQVLIRVDIYNFEPQLEDVDYPKKLVTLNQNSATSHPYSTWYPTLESSLTLLSNMYRSVQPHVFEMVAQDAVAACIHSLHNASKSISTKIDSYLFLIKHLAILRDQISPFDVDFARTERSLDLSHISNSFRMLISLHLPALELSQVQIDPQRDLEDYLKNACEAFIIYTANVLTNSEQQQKATSNDELVRSLSEAIMDVHPDSFRSKCEDIRRQVSLYIGDTRTDYVLIKAIKDNLQQIFSEVRAASFGNSELDKRLQSLEAVVIDIH